MGYGWLQLALEGDRAQLALGTILALVVLKIVATSFTIGSGGSGGVFAPGLFIGGMVGAGLWGLLQNHVPWLPEAPAPFVIVGMMALFGGVAKAPIAVILMVAEMTNEFSMIIPAMLATTLAYLIAGESKIYESQVDTRAQSPAHMAEYVIPLVQHVTVGDAMRTAFTSLAPDTTIEHAELAMAERGRKGFVVLDGGGLAGIFTATDAVRAEREGLATVGQAMTEDVTTALPSDSVHEALRRMSSRLVSRLPVVDPRDPARVLGMIDAGDIAAALDRQMVRLPAPHTNGASAPAPKDVHANATGVSG
jgi:CIC family chloride channel protein